MYSHRRSRTLAIETLESRRLLAGDINTIEDNGVLSIYGDRFDNAIAVRSSSDGVIELIGLNRSGLPTTIYGQPTKLFPNITSIIFEFDDARDSINTGNDAVVITNLTYNGSVKIHMGDGNDFVGLGQFDNSAALVDAAVNSLLGPVSIKTGLTIDLEGGSNTLAAEKLSVKGPPGPNLAIATGTGIDQISLKTVSVARGTIITAGGAITLNIDNLTTTALSLALGVGNDQVSLTHSTIGVVENAQGNATGVTGGITMTTNFGNDVVTFEDVVVGSLSAVLGRGDDSLTLTSVGVLLDTTIDVGDGNDAVIFHTVSVHPLAIFAGAGNDQVSMTNVSLGVSRINAGEGANSVALTTAGVKSLAIATGAGVDTVALSTVTVALNLSIAVGAGNDTVNLSSVSANSLVLALGAGNDSTSFNAVRIAGASKIFGGVGNDGVVLADLQSNSLDVMLEGGRDKVSVHKVRTTKKALFGGGAGQDKYTNMGENSFAKLARAKIETFGTGLSASSLYIAPATTFGPPVSGTLMAGAPDPGDQNLYTVNS